jgi:hypothetical protein
MRHLRQGVPGQCLRPVPDAAPVIARQNDLLDLLFLCEIYCPTGALYVATNAEGPTGVSEAQIEAKGLFGQLRAGIRMAPRQARRCRQGPDLPLARDGHLRVRPAPRRWRIVE